MRITFLDYSMKSVYHFDLPSILAAPLLSNNPYPKFSLETWQAIKNFPPPSMKNTEYFPSKKK